MSLRSRARRVQRAARITYQQALDRLRALGAAPAELGRRSGWPLSRCDLYLVDQALDPEYREVAGRSVEVRERPCAGCGQDFFTGELERRAGVDRCPRCRLSPQWEDAVMGLPLLEYDVEGLLRLGCRQLAARTGARAVMLLGKDGRVLAHHETPGEHRVLAFATAWTLVRRQRITAPLRALAGARPSPLQALIEAPASLSESFVDAGQGLKVFTAGVGGAALLVVLCDEDYSLGMLRLYTRGAITAMERILRGRSGPLPSGGGPTGSAGGGGAPAEVGLMIGLHRRDPARAS